MQYYNVKIVTNYLRETDIVIALLRLLLFVINLAIQIEFFSLVNIEIRFKPCIDHFWNFVFIKYFAARVLMFVLCLFFQVRREFLQIN